MFVQSIRIWYSHRIPFITHPSVSVYFIIQTLFCRDGQIIGIWWASLSLWFCCGRAYELRHSPHNQHYWVCFETGVIVTCHECVGHWPFVLISTDLTNTYGIVKWLWYVYSIGMQCWIYPVSILHIIDQTFSLMYWRINWYINILVILHYS